MSGARTGERPAEGDPLDETLASAVGSAGARFGGVYVLDPTETVLGLIALCGVSVDAFAPWWRVLFGIRGPSQDAIREERFVWVSSLEELAHTYPRAAAAIPFECALAVVPLTGVRHCRGVLVLTWTPGRSATLSRRERSLITLSAQAIARTLDEAADPPVIPDRPRFVPPHHSAGPQSQPGLAALDLVERLPFGTLALDLEGRITLVNAAAATLLARPAEQLLGTLPWQSLSWLDNTTYMDTYRLAVSSQEMLALTVLRPPDQWLDFRLHANDNGMSIVITPDRASKPVAVQPPSAGSPAESRIHLLMVLAAALTETLGVQDVVDLVADQILPAFGAHGMIMSTVEGSRIRIIGHRGYTPDVIEQLDGLPTDADLTPAGRALASGAASFFADRGELTRLYPEVPQVSGKQSWAFLPLISSGRPLGCLLLSYNHPHAFTVAERSILTPLAGLVAQALDRAHLYETKHSLAHTLQQALLPRTLPTVAGLDVAARYLPASHGMDIGGDFYDLIRLTDTTVAAIIGDVQGHDMTAASLMGQVRMAVHSHATAGAAPDQVLTRTDRDLADLDADRFVTCLYAHLDLARQRVTITSAGHPPPLLRLPDSRAHLLDIRPGPPLGLGIGTPSYPLSTVSFPTASLLALYTDGLVETPGIDVAETTANLARHLGELGGSPLHELVDALVRYSGRTNHHTDDTALLLLQPNRAVTS